MPGAYTYTFTAIDSYNCTYDTTITVTVNQALFAGADLSRTICGDQNGYDLNNAADPTKDAGGVWRDLDNTGFLTDANTGSFDAQNFIAGSAVPKTATFSYFLAPNPGCDADSAVITLIVYPEAFAGSANLITVCNSETALDLLGAGGLNTNQTNGTWTVGPPIGFGTLTANQFLDLTTGGNLTSPAGYVDNNGGAPYVWTYNVNNGVCPADEAILQILVNETGVPGGGTTIDLCSGDPVAFLFDSLVGTPDNTGTWTISGGGILGGTDPNRTFDPAAQTVNGPFTASYSVPGRDAITVCPDSVAMITIKFQMAPVSGTAQTVGPICTSAGTYDLFNSLAAPFDTYGTWTDDNNLVSLSGANMKDVDLNSVAFPTGQDTVSGDFTYTVSTTNTICNTSSTTVRLSFTRKSNAGTSNSITVCENSPNFTLVSALATAPDPSVTFTGGMAGSYSAPNNTAIFSPAFPGLAGTTSTITATDTANGPGCTAATATIAITVTPKPVAGPDSDTAKACITDPTYDLATLLDPAVVTTVQGYWTLKNGALPGQPGYPLYLNPNGLVSIDATGGNGFPACGDTIFFAYHDTAVACIEDVAFHGLFVRCIPEAGPNDSTYVCSDEAVFTLFDLLSTADTTGKFFDINGSGGLSQTPNNYKATFDPSLVNANNRYPIAYVIDNNPCVPPDTAFVYVYVSRRPRAGVGDSATVCEDDSVFDLYEMLTQNFDRKGKWVLDMMAPYDVTVNNTVNTNRPAFFSGADSNLFDVKEFVDKMRNSTSPLFTQNAPFFPAYIRFKYVASDTTNFGPNPPLCPDSVTFGILEISKKFLTPTPKSAVATEVCASNCAFNLNSLVNNIDFYPYTAKDKIVWTATPTIAANFIDNDTILQACNVTPGTYTFTLSITTAGCDPITVSNIKLKIVGLPNAGTSATTTVCENGPTVNISAVGGLLGVTTDNTGGSLTLKSTHPFPVNGLQVTGYNPTDGPGTYQFEYTVVKAACPGTTSKATATIIVQAPPFNPGDQTVTICEGEILLLSTVVPTADPNGTFNPTSGGACAGAVVPGSPYISGTFDGSLPGLAGSSCPVEYCVDNGICPAECFTITVNVNKKPFAGADLADTVCSTENAFNLYNALLPADAGGIFTGSPFISGNNFNATLVNAPTTVNVNYRVTAAGCPDDTASIALYVEKAPQAGTDAFREFCASTRIINMTSQLNGARDTGGVWTPADPAWLPFMSGTSRELIDIQQFAGQFPTVSEFIMTYTVTGKQCPNDQSVLTFRIVDEPRAGRDTTVTICESTSLYNLETALGSAGSYDVGGTFRNPAGVAVSKFVTPSDYGPGTFQFTYSVASSVCATGVAKINVIISPTPNAGPDRADTIFLCANSATINFGTYLNGAQSTGVWSNHTSTFTGINANGNYVVIQGDAGKRGTIKYVVSSPGCSSDTSFFKVAVNTTPAPLADPNQTVCLSNTAINLNDYYPTATTVITFSISPQPGTNNNQAISNSALSGNTFYPGLAGNGKYVITVTQTSTSCPTTTSPLTINVVGPGNDTTIDACINSAPFDLNVLTKATGITGTWTVTPPPVPTGLVVGNTFFPQQGVVGTTYTVDLSTTTLNCNAKAVITIVDTISVTSSTTPATPGVEVLCNAAGFYQVRFKINGGTKPYTVNGNSGSFDGTGTIFTSDNIPFSGIYNFLVSSASNCGNLVLKGSSECGDVDVDGVYDLADLDDDNDGIPDVVEAGGFADANADANADGIPNYKDAAYCTTVGGTMNGAVCAVYDFDGDQRINQVDLDSDNDGISDIFDGLDTTNAVAFDGILVNGIIQAPVFTDANKNGWHDAAEAAFTGPGKSYATYFALAVLVKTTPGVADYLNLDSDGDTISDFAEGGKGITNRPPNSDATATPASQRDNKWDFRDTDADGDFVADKYEGGMDGDINTVPNSDGTGLPDFQDRDADDDGMADNVDSKVVSPSQLVPEDFDGDGLFNFQDIDSDNDNILDIVEKGPVPAGNTNPIQTTTGLFDYTNLDSDADGICDIWEGHLEGQVAADAVSDADSDGLADYVDTDSDGDLIPDEVEGGADATANCGEPLNTDNDRDGYDFRDLDSDNDGLSDRFEAGANPKSPRESGDDDNDYDFQDLDSDGDCIPDAVEAIAAYAGHSTTGLNGDKAFTFLSDSDVPDYLNLDSDGDGILDSEEVGPDCGSPVDSDGDLFPDFRDNDSDNDGVSDRVEKDGDCDGDGKPNYQDAGDNCDITTFVPEGFSPNNDGTNDYFEIPDLKEFPQASLKVFNRWGGLIFESNRYDNRWDGRYDGEDVPQGTYFYLLDLGIGKDAQKGYIYINR